MVAYKRNVLGAVTTGVFVTLPAFAVYDYGVNAASEGNGEHHNGQELDFFDPFALSPGFGGGFNVDGFGSALQNMEKSMQSMLGHLHGVFGHVGSIPLQVKIPSEDEDSRCSLCVFVRCRVNIHAKGKFTGSLRVYLDVKARTLNVSQHAEEQKRSELKEGEKKSFRAESASSSSSATVSLPERCIVKEDMIQLGYCGYIPVEDASGAKSYAVVMPSRVQINELIESELLDERAVSILDSESSVKLTGKQQCLLMGFSEGECTRLGDKRPEAEPQSDVNLREGVQHVPKLIGEL